MCSQEPTRARLGGRGSPAVMVAAVARRYYFDGLSKIEIGRELELSRFQVARLLDLARSSGLVNIEISYPDAFIRELSDELAAAFGLNHALVVDTSRNGEMSPPSQLGEATAQLVNGKLSSDDVLGITWSRAVSCMGRALPDPPRIPVVQLTGSLFGPHGDDSTVDAVRQIARNSGGTAYFFHAPLVVPTPSTALELRRQPEVAQAFGQFPTVTKAFVGVGAWQPGHSTLYDALSEQDRRAMAALGACGDFAGIFVRDDGQIIDQGIADRIIGISAETLRSVPDVFGIAYNPVKSKAVRAAVRSGLVNSLVVDSSLAEALLVGC